MSIDKLTVARSKETEFEWSWPLAIWAISCMGPPLDKISHSDLSRSFPKKSNSRFGETGIQTEVAAFKTIPGGSPGSFTLFLVIILTSSSTLPTLSLLHFCSDDAQTPPQKLSVILFASFNMLFLPLQLMGVGLREGETVEDMRIVRHSH